MPRSTSAAILVLVALLLLVSGCTTARKSNTARTAREQLLISNAVDQALSKVDFAAFQGQRVLVEEKYLDCTDKGYILGSIRHRLMLNGATIAAKPEEADVVVELRSGGVGTDDSDSYLGIPEIVLPGMLTLPEVKLVTRTRQSALAKIGMVAYDAKSHELLGEGGVSSSLSDDNNLFVLGVGPFQSGSAKQEMNDTTLRRVGQPNQPLSTTVAFSAISNPESDHPERLQLTGEQTQE